MFPNQRLFFISGKFRTNLDPLLMYLRERHEKFLAEREARFDEEGGEQNYM
jgi:hypothetical protein